MATTNAFLNYTVQNDDLALGDLSAIDLDLSGNLRVAGSINPGTFTNRVIDSQLPGLTLAANQSGSTIFLNRALGISVVLPAAAPGLNFDFVVLTAIAGAGNSYVISPAGANSQFFGAICNQNNAGAGSGGVFSKTGGATVTMVITGGGGGTVTGGLIGSNLHIEAIKVNAGAENTWCVTGTVASDGAAPVTPFT